MWFGKIVLFLYLLSSSFSQKNNSQKCKRNDSNFQQCLQQYVQDYIPFLAHDKFPSSLQSLDPVNLRNVIFPRGKLFNIEVKHDFLSFYGFSKLKVTHLEINFENNTIIFNFVVPSLRWESKFKIQNGTIYGKDINAEAYGIAWCENWNFKNQLSFVKYFTNQVEFIELTSFDNLVIPGKSEIKLLNINSDAAVLENTISNNLTTLWKDAGRSYELYFGKLVFNYLNNIFKRFTVAQLFD